MIEDTLHYLKISMSKSLKYTLLGFGLVIVAAIIWNEYSSVREATSESREANEEFQRSLEELREVQKNLEEKSE